MENIEITMELLTEYVGGQMEIKNHGKGYLLRGQIRTVAFQNEEIRVEFVWLAKNQGSPLNPMGWVKDDGWGYAVDLKESLVSCGRGNNLRFESSVSGEIITLFPPDGERIDSAMVQGLELAEA